MNVKIMKYNPAFLTDEELVRSFVVRQADLELILEVIRENTSNANQHVLVIGPRGMGKTMIVLRGAIEVRRTEELTDRWYPIVFGEESYNVGTPGEFWLEALFHLHKQTKDERWQQTHDELKEERDEFRLRESALASLMDFADEQKKRLLLIVENLNMILGQQFDKGQAWSLRHTLLNEPRVMLLATAVRRFEEIEGADKAMYELLKPLQLMPLADEECRTLWKSISGQEISALQIRPFKILTGGNPRLLIIISSFAANRSFRELMEELTHLVDEHTEYFKSHLDNLPAQERKVYAALADIWDPATARQVAQAARLGVSTTSSLLNRLVDRGAVEVIDQEGRKKWYQLSERMYNIYHLMRRRGTPSDRVRAAVKFITYFYQGEELVGTVASIAQEACKLGPDLRSDHYLAYEILWKDLKADELRSKILSVTPREFLAAPDVPVSLRELTKQAEISQIYEESKNLVAEVFKLLSSPASSEKKHEIDETLKRCRDFAENRKSNPIAWSLYGLLLEDGSGDFNEAERAYRKATEIDQDDALPWTHLGKLLHQKLRRYQEAEQAYRKAIEIDQDYASAWGLLGHLLHEELERYKEAEQAYRKAVEIDPKYVLGWAHLGQLLHEELDRYEEAEEAYRKAIELKPDYAWAWAQLGQLLHEKLKRYEEAAQAYGKAVEIEPDFTWGWAQLGELLDEKLERYEEAEQAYRKAIEISPDYAWAWAQLGQLLHEKLKRYEEAEQAYRKATEIDSDDAWAWTHLGELLHEKLGRHEEAEEAYRKALEADPKFVPASFELARLLVSQPGRSEEALQIAKEAVKETGGDPRALHACALTFLDSDRAEQVHQAVTWATEAVEKEPENADYVFTLSLIYRVVGMFAEAFDLFPRFLRNMGQGAAGAREATDFAIGLAAAGYAEQVLEILQNSDKAASLEPLVVALRLYTGEKVKVAQEILEVARDVVKRIEERKKELDERKAAPTTKGQ